MMIFILFGSLFLILEIALRSKHTSNKIITWIKYDDDFAWVNKEPLPLPQHYKVMVIGDSSAWGYGVKREERFSSYIDAVNLAVCGWGTSQAVKYALANLENYTPDYIVIYLSWNDVWDNNYFNKKLYKWEKPLFWLNSKVDLSWLYTYRKFRELYRKVLYRIAGKGSWKQIREDIRYLRKESGLPVMVFGPQDHHLTAAEHKELGLFLRKECE